MNVKMIKYYEDCLKHVVSPKHKNYLETMLEYFKGDCTKPLIVYGRIAKKARP